MSEPFDFDAFIKGTQLARSTVAVYKVDNRAEISRLQAEHDRLPDESGDQRETTKASPRRKLAEKIAQLRNEMLDSRTEFVIRTLTPDELKSLTGDDTDVFDQLELQSRAPADCPTPAQYADLPQLTAGQWRQIASAIGSAQWGQVVAEANALVITKVAVPDFSRSVLETLNPPTRSES